MDRQEAVLKLIKVARITKGYAEDLYDSFFPKPVVPQYVANWYEGNKQNLDLNLSGLVFDLATNSPIYYNEEFKEWVEDNKETFITTFVNMHQFGYEVEKEPRYTVKIKGRLGQYLGKYYLNNEELTPQFTSTQYSEGSNFTRTELEASGLGWVFDCPGVEVKEVDDGND